jgi:hypothetical protein
MTAIRAGRISGVHGRSIQSFLQHAPAGLVALGLLVGSLASAQVATAQETGRTIQITGDRLGGFVLPVLPVESDIILNGLQSWTWKVDDTLRIQLEGDVQIDVGGYAFSAGEALVWINRIPSADGLVNQLAVYFTSVEEPTRRAGLGVTGEDVLIVGTARGEVSLATSVRTTSPPPLTSTLRRGEERLALYLRGIAASPPPLRTRPEALAPSRPELPTPVPGASPLLPDTKAKALAELPRTVDLPATTTEALPIFQPEGMVSFTANQIDVDQEHDTVIADGQFMVDFDPMGSNDDFTPLQLSAGGGVIFLREGAVGGLQAGERQMSVEDVTGIYLEGDVTATDGKYTVRSKAVYYDLHTNQALMVDALLRTYSRLIGDKPIYARAAEMRQLSSDQWEAKQAIVSTSSFFVPQLSIGLERVTISRRPGTTDAPEDATTWVEGVDLTVRAGGIPFFYLPEFSANADAIPFRSLKLGYDEDYGAEIGTEWDLFSLLGMAEPDDTRGELAVDVFTERGVGTGVELDTSGKSYEADLKAYGLYDTGGEDLTSAGVTKQIQESGRGEIMGSYAVQLSSDLEFRANLAWLSDPTFASAWRREEFDTRPEYMTGALLDYRDANAQLTLETNYSVIPFVANNYLMASRPYYVDKMPELAYRRYADSLFDDSVTWNSEYSAAYMRQKVTNGTPDSLGVPNAAFATTNPNQDISELYYGQAGYTSDFVTRVDTRQEMSLPLDYGSTNVVPYAMTRFTGYFSDKFTRYNPDAKRNRLFGSIGLKANTTFMQVHNDVRNELLDVDRLRHVVRPYMHAWIGADTLDAGGLPVYDQEVEAMSAGTAVRMGVRQTFQTKRGGPGRQKSVDWIDLDLGTVLNDSTDVYTLADARTPWNYAQSPTPTWVDWRPELSQWGSHLYGNLEWSLSDTFTIGGSTVYLVSPTTGLALEEDGSLVAEEYDGLMNGSVGFQVQHTPAMSTYLEYRYIKPGQTELLQGGVAYEVGRRYILGVTPQYDLRANDLRAINAVLTRTFTDFDLQFEGGFDVIRDSPTFSLRLALPSQGTE